MERTPIGKGAFLITLSREEIEGINNVRKMSTELVLKAMKILNEKTIPTEKPQSDDVKITNS